MKFKALKEKEPARVRDNVRRPMAGELSLVLKLQSLGLICGRAVCEECGAEM